MGLFDKLFGSKQTTNTSSQQQSQQQGSGFSQSNLWPQIGGYLGNFDNVFSPQGPNQYQTGAANQQAALGTALAPAFQSAWNVAGQGIQDSDINRFSNQYDTSVINNMIADYAKQNQQTLDAGRGRQAAQAALGNRTGADALILEGQQGAQADAIMKARQGGFNTATGLARDNAALQLQGAGQLGQLGSVASGINQTGFGMGQQLWQNPFAQFGQVSSAISPWAQAAGQNTNYSGTSSGTSTGQSTTFGSPSPFEAIMTGLGTAAKAYGAFKRDGGAVRRASGGSVTASSFADKVKAAHAAVKEMNEGGNVERPNYDMGGWVTDLTMGSLSPGEADAMVDTATAADSSNYWNKMGDAFGGYGGAKKSQPQGNPGMDALTRQQQGLSSFMAQTDPRQYLPKMARGGVLGMYAGGNPDAYEALPLGATPGVAVDYDPPSAWQSPALGEAFSPYGGALSTFGDRRALDVAPPATTEVAGARYDAPMPPPRYQPQPARSEPKTGIAGYLERLGKAFSGEDESGWSGAGTAFLAAGIPSSQRMAAAIHKSREALQQQMSADRIAQMKLAEMRGYLPDAMGGGETLAAKQLAESQRMHDASIRATNVGADINEAKLEDLKDPNRVYDRREAVADRLGLERGSRERNEFVATGDFPRLANQTQDAQAQAQARRKAVIEQGGNPEDPHTKQFILTGKFPREDQAPLTATDKKAILESEELGLAGSESVKALRSALALNNKINTGLGSGIRTWAGDTLHDYLVPDFISSPESAKASVDYDNLVLGQALASLKATFGAAPTEGERLILLELQASRNKSPAARKDILDRAIGLAERRVKFHQERAAELRGGTFYKPGERAGAGKSKAIPTMSLDELGKLDRATLTPEQLQEAAKRYNELQQQKAAPLP